ncbi:MAG: DEAD/DEAH box helicase [Candidatus Delongbacteria bacterium]
MDRLHREGPTSLTDLEALAYYKRYHSLAFTRVEGQILAALGLFHKVQEDNNLYSFLMSGFGRTHEQEYGKRLTPIQASVSRSIDSMQYVSISAPTSSGKSYAVREYIARDLQDAVVIVPSRALIAEYMGAFRDRFRSDKNVMICPFVEQIFTVRAPRRIFVLTPERTKDLFRLSRELQSVGTFFLDEAQISEDDTRGVLFDVTVRRIIKHFPRAKLVFAHPFVINPEAQFSKHEIDFERGYAHSYDHGSVGRICVFRHSNGRDYCFSPYLTNGHHLKNCVQFECDFPTFCLSPQHSILVYVSKASIYDGSYLTDFSDHITDLPPIEEPDALRIVSRIVDIIGANENEHRSDMITLLRKGVVIHHGSVPLEVRFLIEDFIRGGHAVMCFATSTLAQGVNMPFDVVWLKNPWLPGREKERALAFKNLIGRAGRLTSGSEFDFGYVYTTNPKLFIDRMNFPLRLDEASIIETGDYSEDSDTGEYLNSIRENTFDEDKNLPMSRVERLSTAIVLESASQILDSVFADARGIRASIGGEDKAEIRHNVCDCYRKIYEAALGRCLVEGEVAVFSQAIQIFLHTIQGRAFKEIVGIRYSHISRRNLGRQGQAEFSQAASQLPNKTLVRRFPLFVEGTPANVVSYDAVLFDTYDYLDQVISFCLSDTFVAAFKIYSERTIDDRADRMIELLKYGTNNAKHILLMRYGFAPDRIEEIAEYVDSITVENIVFRNAISEAPDHVREIIEWYLPE